MALYTRQDLAASTVNCVRLQTRSPEKATQWSTEVWRYLGRTRELDTSLCPRDTGYNKQKDTRKLMIHTDAEDSSASHPGEAQNKNIGYCAVKANRTQRAATAKLQRKPQTHAATSDKSAMGTRSMMEAFGNAEALLLQWEMFTLYCNRTRCLH